jgi:chromosome segregation ATPase
LVHQNNKLQELGEAVSSLENKKTILEQKKSRLNANYKSFEKEISVIQIGLKGLQYDMNKLNDGLAVNNEKRGKLLNENVNIESEFGQKLKVLERESVSLEVQIDALREEKADLLNQIIECEKQILLWERNYQLEREMQDALDPNVGQSEIEDLKK